MNHKINYYNMKKSLLGLQAALPGLIVATGFLLAAPAGLFAQAATGFRISGHLKNVQAEWIYLVYAKDGRQTLDSAKVNNGSYVFTGEILESNPATLLDVMPLGGRLSPKSMAKIYLMPESFVITHIDSFSNTLITGSTVNTDFKKIQEEVNPYADREMAFLPRYKAAQEAKDDSTLKAIKQQVHEIDKEIDDKVYGPYTRNNPQSPLALYVLQLYAANDPDAGKLQPLFDGLSSAVRDSKVGTAFQQKLTVAAATSVGNKALDFTQNDTLGNPVKLSSFRGKYVLLDFWASWCAPCRAENPSVVTIYNKYHVKGFDILSVSLDKPGDKAKWMKAIHDDQLSWTNVSDLQFWDNAAAKEYGIRSIPQNFLIDPQGKIIAKNLRGDELEKELAEVYKD